MAYGDKVKTGKPSNENGGKNVLTPKAAENDLTGRGKNAHFSYDKKYNPQLRSLGNSNDRPGRIPEVMKDSRVPIETSLPLIRESLGDVRAVLKNDGTLISVNNGKEITHDLDWSKLNDLIAESETHSTGSGTYSPEDTKRPLFNNPNHGDLTDYNPKPGDGRDMSKPYNKPTVEGERPLYNNPNHGDLTDYKPGPNDGRDMTKPYNRPTIHKPEKVGLLGRARTALGGVAEGVANSGAGKAVGAMLNFPPLKTLLGVAGSAPIAGATTLLHTGEGTNVGEDEEMARRNALFDQTQAAVQPEAAPEPIGEPVDKGIDPSAPVTNVPTPPAPQPGAAMTKAGSDPVKQVPTGGGSFPVYQKNSAEAGDFRTAFATAVKSGAQTFNWQGREYNTRIA